MFKRHWFKRGIITSDEGFQVYFGHRSAYYQDSRGKFELGYEDGLLSARLYQVSGQPVALNQTLIDQVVERMVRALTSAGYPVQVVRKAGP